MSDMPIKGYWQASDGKWYPPAPPATVPQQAIRPSDLGPPPYQTTGYYQPEPVRQQQHVTMVNTTKSPGLAIASLILGIGAFFIALLPVIGFTTVPFALVGLSLGVAGLSRALKGFEGMGMSIVGITTNILALLVTAAWLTVFSTAGNGSEGSLGATPTIALTLVPLLSVVVG